MPAGPRPIHVLMSCPARSGDPPAADVVVVPLQVRVTEMLRQPAWSRSAWIAQRTPADCPANTGDPADPRAARDTPRGHLAGDPVRACCGAEINDLTSSPVTPRADQPPLPRTANVRQRQPRRSLVQPGPRRQSRYVLRPARDIVEITYAHMYFGWELFRGEDLITMLAVGLEPPRAATALADLGCGEGRRIGWGAFTAHAGRQGIQVTSLTISAESER